MATTDPLPHLLTIDELAGQLGITIRHVRRLVAERRVPYLKVTRSKQIFELSECCQPRGGVHG